MTEEPDSINFFEPRTIAELMPKYLKEVERRWDRCSAFAGSSRDALRAAIDGRKGGKNG